MWVAAGMVMKIMCLGPMIMVALFCPHFGVSMLIVMRKGCLFPHWQHGPAFGFQHFERARIRCEGRQRFGQPGGQPFARPDDDRRSGQPLGIGRAHLKVMG
jgi:hypothetical protein